MHNSVLKKIFLLRFSDNLFLCCFANVAIGLMTVDHIALVTVINGPSAHIHMIMQ